MRPDRTGSTPPDTTDSMPPDTTARPTRWFTSVG